MSLLASPVAEQRPIAEILNVQAGHGCLDRDKLALRTTGWLGRDMADGRLEINVVAEGNAAVGFQLRRDGEVRAARTMDPAPSDCAELHAALGLAIAIAIDASVLESLGVETVPAPTPAPAQPETEVAPNLEADRPPPRPDKGPQLRGAVDLGGAAWIGVLPTPGFGGGVGVDFGWVEWLDLRAGAVVAAGLPFDLGEGSTLPVLAAAQLGLCPARAFGRFRLRLCVSIAAGAITAQGRDFADARLVRVPWVAGIAGADAHVALGRTVALGIGADLVAPIVRAEFDARDSSGVLVERRSAAAAGGAFGLDVAVRFGDWSAPR